MGQFRVHYRENGLGYIDVQARNEEDAEDIAYDLITDGGGTRDESTYDHDILAGQTEEI